MKSLLDIKSTLTGNLSMLSSKYPIERLAIFGSFSRNEQHEDSDIDLLVEFNDRIGIEFIDLANELEELLGCHVDLVSLEGIKSKYLKAIEPQLIYV